jgi:hypothetical protein
VSFTAPLRVPVELRDSSRGRWFRLAHEVSPEEVALGSAAPDELDGPVQIAFHLPGDAQPIRCRAKIHEMRLDEDRAERRLLRLFDLDEASAARIQTYVRERLNLVE